MRSTVAFSAALLLAMPPSSALAQSGILAGTVTSDSAARHQLVGAEVSIPALQLTTRTNFGGDYQFDRLVAGRYLVIVTSPGFKSVGDSVSVAASGETYHDFVLSTRVAVLDTVVATAASPVTRFISPGLRGFDERKKEGLGHFIDDSILRKYDSYRLSDIILQRVPGVVFTPSRGTALYLSSGRKQFPGRVLSGSNSSAYQCWVSLYIDGALVYNYGMEGRSPAGVAPPLRPDFSRINVADYAGVEFYAGGSTFPPWISPTNNDCGVLLLWSREK